MIGWRAGPRQGFDERHRSGELQGAGLPHLTHHEDLLAAVLLHCDADIRVREIAFGQAAAELVFDAANAQPADLHSAEQRK